MITLHLPGVYAAGEMKQDHSDIARDGLILALWGEKKDTRDISRALNMREAAVANRLAWLRDRAAGK
jgi:hypothetical protein